MLQKFNTLLRLIVVCLLIYPFPIAIADEVQVNEGFEDTTYEAGFTISATSDPVQIYSSEQNQYGTTGVSLALCNMNQSCTAEYTFEFSSDIDVYEVGFIVGAVNQAYAVIWHYSDGTTETENKSAQSNSNLSTMYDDFYKSFTDYNADENNTDKFIKKFVVDIHDYSLIDTLYFQYDDSTATGSFATTTTTTTQPPVLGAPINVSSSQTYGTGVLIDWDATDTGNQVAESWEVYYYQVDNQQNAQIICSVLVTECTIPYSSLPDDTYKFYIVGYDNENNIYSSASATTELQVSNTPPTPDNASSVSVNYSGEDVEFSWIYTDGNIDAHSFHINYSYDNETFTRVIITDTSLREYDLDKTNTETGTFYWVFSVCGDLDNGEYCTDSDNNNFQTTEWVATLGPPMNPEVSNVYDSGVRVKWDAPNTGNQTADTYELYYRTSPTDEVVIYNISNTEYTIPYANIPNGTYEFSIRAFDSDYNVYSGYSTEPTLEVFNQKAKEDADAAAEAERKRREYEAEQARLQAIEDEKKSNYNETGYYETDAERSSREQKEYEEEQARIAAEKDKNFAETGYYELDFERADREQKEYEAEQERLRLEEEARLKAIQEEKDANFAETGYYELDSERTAREDAEEEARIQKELEESVLKDVDTESLTEEEKSEVKELVDTIQRLQEELEIIEIEEEVFEVPDIVVLQEPKDEVLNDGQLPEEQENFDIEEDIAEADVDELRDEILSEEEIVEILPDTISKKDFEVIQDKSIEELDEEEVEIVVAVAEKSIEKVVKVEEVFEDVEIIEEEELETLSEEEIQAYEEEVEEAATLAVQQLETEEKVEVVKEVAKVKVQNLATADTTTKAVVKAVVQEVTKVETVAELDEEEKQAVGEVLGFEEETAAEDVEIIAEQAAKEENIATAVEQYVERAIENSDVEDFTLADVVVEVQVEVFLSDPVGAIIDVDLENIDFATIGQDMTQDQRQKSKEVVVPVIIASQIVAQAGALITRRPF